MARPAMRTFLFSDLRDYTLFNETRGDAATTRMLRASRRIVRAAVARHRGAEIKTEGDSFYVVFRSPSSAVRCAVEIQRAISDHNARHPDVPVHMGIGINTGEAMPHEDGYVGSAVIVASRLKDNARAGQILVTETVRSLVRSGAHAPMHDRGTWTLKGITEPVHVFDVDVEPASATRALGPALPLPPAVAPPALTPGGLVACPELIQREEQMRILTEHLEAAAHGESRVVVLTGEAGVGKSRLCRELASIAHREGHYVLAGRAHSARALPYEPILAALRPYARARGSDVLRRLLGPLVTELRRLLPEIDVPVTAGEPAPDSERRERFARAIQLMIEDAASQRPVLMVLEDLQEADGSTLDMVLSLSSSLRSGLLVLLTYREEDVGPRHPLRAILAELDRSRRASRLRLAPLDAEGVRAMTQRLLPGRASEELARSVFERSEGIPYYVEELLKTAADDTSGQLEIALPLSIRDSVQLRVARLIAAHGSGVADLLEVLAVAGMPLSDDVLATASRRELGAVAQDMNAALEAQLVERPPTRRELYQFRHAITRETVLAEIDPARRRELHASLATALEADARPGAAGMLARHFEAAGDRSKALRYLREGAMDAVRVGAQTTAIALLEQALALASGALHAEIAHDLAAALCAAGRATEAETVLRRASQRDRTLDDAALARTLTALAATLRMQGRREEAVDAAERAVQLLSETGSPYLGQALCELAELAFAAGDAGRAADLALQALAVADRAKRPAQTVTAMTILGMAQVRVSPARALETLREAIRLASGAGLPAETVTAWLELSRALLARGEFAEAGASAETGLRLARDHGLEFLQSHLLAQLTTVLVNHGQYREARDVAEQAVALARPETVASDNAKIGLAHVLTNQGDHSAALALFDQITPRIDRYDPVRRITFHAYRAQALVVAGRLEEAAASGDAAVEQTTSTPGNGMTGFLAAASVAETRRDLPGLRGLARRFDEYFVGRDTGPIRACRAEIAAITVALEGGDAATGFAELAAMYDGIGARVHALYRRGSAAIAQLADPARARAARAQLAEIRIALAERMAMRYVLLLDTAAARPRTTVRTTGLLAGRQLRVALMVAQGYTDQRISRELGVSMREASHLVAQVLQRLGVRTRSQVASWVVAREPEKVGVRSF